jgi:hypothetical protein
MRIDVQNEERGLSFKGGEEERPSLHALQVSLQKREAHSRERGTP